MRHLKTTFGFVLAFVVGTAFAAITQRPLDPRTGKSAGVGYGTTLPSDPHSDEIYVLTSASTNPYPHIYDANASAWRTILTAAGESQTVAGVIGGSMTSGYLPYWNGSAYVNSDFSISGTVTTLDDGSTLKLGDNEHLVFGDGSDAHIYFDGSSLILDPDGVTQTAWTNIRGGYQAGSTIATIGDGSRNWVTFSQAPPTSSSLSFINFTPNNGVIASSGHTQNIVNITVDSENHSNGTLNAFRVDTLATPDPQATENAITINGGWDNDINFVDTTPVVTQAANSVFTFKDGTTSPLVFRGAPTTGQDSWAFTTGTTALPANSSIDFMALTFTSPSLNGSDTINGLKVDMTNAGSHSGSANFLNAIYLDGVSLVGSVTETGLHIGTGFEYHIFLNDPDAYVMFKTKVTFASDPDWGTMIEMYEVPAAGAGLASAAGLLNFNITSNAMDAVGSDEFAFINFEGSNAAHTGGMLSGIKFENLTSSGATEYAINIGSGWDRMLYGAASITMETAGGYTFQYANGQSWYFSDGSGYDFAYTDEDGWQQDFGTTLAVVGAGQTVNPSNNFVQIGAAAGASVAVVTAPATASGQLITFVCNDANVTFNDADAAGAAGTINLSGAATNFTCSQDDTLTLLYVGGPAAGNGRWMEVSRSVN